MNLSGLVENLFLKKNPLQGLLSRLNAVISTNDSAQFTIYNPAYTGIPWLTRFQPTRSLI